MGNKPPPKTLSRWWKSSIREGLKRVKKSKPAFSFELVYWAHYLHPTPLKPRIKDTEHPLYIEDRYFRAPPNAVEEKPSELRQKLVDYVSEQLDKIFLNNDYVYGDQKNPHKSFGYLRTSEMAEIIRGFLSETIKSCFL
jgi:hypothetical protein